MHTTSMYTRMHAHTHTLTNSSFRLMLVCLALNPMILNTTMAEKMEVAELMRQTMRESVRAL